MKLILAVSADGFLCRGRDDDMRWTGPVDKAIFKLLTLVGNEPLFAGSKTCSTLPKLVGRNVYRLTTFPATASDFSLTQARLLYPNAWLIGGPTVAKEALSLGLISEAVFCKVGVTLKRGVSARPIVRRVMSQSTAVHTIEIDGVIVDICKGAFKY